MLNPKSQITNPKQIPMTKVTITKIKTWFGIWEIGIWKLFVIWCLFIGICGCRPRDLYKDTRIIMGTFVVVISPDNRAAGIAFDEIRRIENLLTKYNPDSEISKLNKLGKLNVSPDTFYLIKKAKEFWLISDGAFDITVAPLVDLWGFTNKKYKVPTKKEIRTALALVGSDKIILLDNDNVVKFKTSGVKIDLGDIAKGYALDCAVKKLRENNIKSCLLDAGGQIFALGDKFGEPWKIAIKNPSSSDITDYLELKNQSVATSGDYEQYFIKDKKRYSHIFNPETGYPANSGIVSVTVIAPDGLTADALATAVFVLGKVKAEALVKKFSNTKVIILKDDGQSN